MKVIWENEDIYGGRLVYKNGLYLKILVFYVRNEEDEAGADAYTLIHEHGASTILPTTRAKLVELLNKDGYEPVNSRGN